MPSARSLIGLAVAVFLVPAAQAATVITGWNANTCSGNALFQFVGQQTCTQSVPVCTEMPMSNANGTTFFGTQGCPSGAVTAFNLSGSTGTYFTVTEYNGPGCNGTVVGSAAHQADQCVSLGPLGLPVFGLANCPTAAGGNISVKIFGDAKCTVPFTGLGDIVAAPGTCLPIPGLGAGFSITGKCSTVAADGSVPIPKMGSAGKTVSSAIAMLAAAMVGILLL